MKYLDGFLLASLVLVGGLHAYLFRVLNAAPVLEMRAAGSPPSNVWMHVDECLPEPGKVMVSGWISAPDQSTRLHATSAAFRDEATGLLHGMTTDLLRATPFFLKPSTPPQQPGMAPTRFVASLNLKAVSPEVSRGRW